jgi:hypothetical protein
MGDINLSKRSNTLLYQLLIMTYHWAQMLSINFSHTVLDCYLSQQISSCAFLLLTHHLQPQPLLCCVIGVVTADCLQSGVGCE